VGMRGWSTCGVKERGRELVCTVFYMHSFILQLIACNCCHFFNVRNCCFATDDAML
jgi:hypothetical protein